MYVSNGLSGYGTSDFNKALKGTNIAAVQKGLDFQLKQLSKRKPKDVRGIEADTAQIAAARARLAELQAGAAPKSVPAAIAAAVTTAAQNAAAMATPPPGPLDVVKPPPVTSAPKTDPTAYVGVPATIPTAAPPAASDAVATIAPANNFGPLPANFGPAESDAAPVAVADDSKMPMILAGVAALAAFVLFARKKR